MAGPQGGGSALATVTDSRSATVGPKHGAGVFKNNA